jgi:uncharacterized protein YacL
MNRRECTTDKVKVGNLAAVYVHTEYERGKPVKVRISSPGKYESQDIGSLLDGVAETITKALSDARA